MGRVDLHVKILDDHVVERAKQRGLDAIVYAPHFARLSTIEKRCRAYTDDELVVVPGRELFAGPWWERRHVLGIGMSDPLPDFLPLSTTIAELSRQDAAVLAPHPTFLSVSLSPAELATYRDEFHAVETYNPKFLPIHTRRARRMADDLGLPAFGSSYAHLNGTIGEVWTEFDDPIVADTALVAALKAGDLSSVGHRNGGRHIARRTLEFSHLFWENSWKKFERLVLRDIEATHPRNPAYPDRFRDLSVY